MAGFGWSMSDLALGIKFVVKIGRALKETGGASADYQKSVEILNGLELTLRNMEQLIPLCPAGVPAEVISTQAKQILSSLAVFKKTIDEFEEPLGAGHKMGLRHGVYHKVKWAAFVSKRAKDLRNDVALPISTVITNLIIHVMQCLCPLQSNLPATICDKVADTLNGTVLTEVRSEIDSIRQAIDAHQARYEQSQLDISGAMIYGPQHLGAQIEELQKVVELNMEARTLSQIRLEKAIAATTGKVRNFQAAVESQTALQGNLRGDIAVNRGLTNPWLELQEHFIKCICLLAIGLHQLLAVLLKLPGRQGTLLFRNMQAISSCVPTLLFGDVIFWEDVLGRRKRLPFEYFQHWETFRGFLRNSFVDIPWSYDVENNQYRLFDGVHGTAISEQNWRTAIQPRSKVLMSVVRIALPGEARSCPRCWLTPRVPWNTVGIKCSNCGLFHRVDSSSTPGDVGPCVTEVIEDETVTDTLHGLTLGDRDEQSNEGITKIPKSLDSNEGEIEKLKRIDTRESNDSKLWLEKVEQLLLLIWSPVKSILERTANKIEATKGSIYLKNTEATLLETATKLKSHPALAELPPYHTYFRECSAAVKYLRETLSRLRTLRDAGNWRSDAQVQRAEAAIILWELANKLQRFNATLDLMWNEMAQKAPVVRIEATSSIPGERDLDPSYEVQRHPKKFFVFGRVFSVLWTEPTSTRSGGTEYTRVRFVEYVYSTIRRFVVVGESNDSCWCLLVIPRHPCLLPVTPDRASRPIASYGRRGPLMPHMKPHDHAIIYTGADPPKPMEGEDFVKFPLQVVTGSPHIKLDPSSRINFGKIYTVEHNIKVCKIGKIAEGSMHLLFRYHKETIGMGMARSVERQKS